MTYDQRKTRSPNPNDEIEWELEPTELDLVYDDLKIALAMKEELLAALKLAEPLLRVVGFHEMSALKTVRAAIAKAERQS